MCQGYAPITPSEPLHFLDGRGPIMFVRAEPYDISEVACNIGYLMCYCGSYCRLVRPWIRQYPLMFVPIFMCYPVDFDENTRLGLNKSTYKFLAVVHQDPTSLIGGIP